MNKLYVGKLSRDVTEDELRKLFEEHDVPVQEILMKKNGFAFVDVSDESMVEKAIEKLNGYHLQGGHIKVEPSVPRKARSQWQEGPDSRQRGNRLKIIIANVPIKVEHKEIEKLATTFGTVTNFEALPQSKNANGSYAVIVTYELPEQAEQAIRQLNGFEYQDSKLRVKFKNGGRPNGRFGGPQGGPGGRMYNHQQNAPDTSNFPVRMLVRSEFVGAIIGKGGNNIRAITKETGCKVDIHRRDNIGSSEKAVTICGEPDQVTQTIKKIMEVMIQESSEESHTDMPLKVLAHNALVGRLIGKNGSSINSIMEDSKAKVTVSLIQDLTVFNPERTVTIYGTPEQCSKAEALISKKLRKAYESYVQNLQPQQHDLFPGLNHMSLMSGGMPHPHGGPQGGGPQGGGPYGGPGPYEGGPYYQNQPPMNAPYGGGPQGGGPMQEPTETTFLYVPREAVGALIGVGGKNIRNTARASNATIRIAPAGNEESNERCVKIIGPAEAQWRAQFYIYDKIRSEGILGSGEVHLRSEISVPSPLVGRIIGKRGQRVRELQRVTGARVEVPRRRGHDGAGDEGNTNPPADDGAPEGVSNGDVIVKLEGHFYANQAAQRRIRQAQQEYSQRQNFQGRPQGGSGGGRRYYRGGPNNNQQHQQQQQQQQQQQ